MMDKEKFHHVCARFWPCFLVVLGRYFLVSFGGKSSATEITNGCSLSLGDEKREVCKENA